MKAVYYLDSIIEAIVNRLGIVLEGTEQLMINGLRHKDPCNKMSLTDFMTKHSIRLKKVVDSCRNEEELQIAETYIRNGLKTFVCNPDSDNAHEFVRLLITPKRLELENIYETGGKK